jgi:hypothetical protein
LIAKSGKRGLIDHDELIGLFLGSKLSEIFKTSIVALHCGLLINQISAYFYALECPVPRAAPKGSRLKGAGGSINGEEKRFRTERKKLFSASLSRKENFPRWRRPTMATPACGDNRKSLSAFVVEL